MTVRLIAINGTMKSAHQSVTVNGVERGEVWRELCPVVVSKLTAPRRTAMKWRWFAKALGSTTTLGRGTRAAMILGAGYVTRKKAVDVLCDSLPSQPEAP